MARQKKNIRFELIEAEDTKDSAIKPTKKKTDLATISIKKALAIEPANKWYKEANATVLVANGKYVEAANIYSELSKSEKQDEEYPVLAAEYYERAGKNQEAINHLFQIAQTVKLRNTLSKASRSSASHSARRLHAPALCRA